MFEVGRLVARISLEGAATFQRDLRQTGLEFSGLSDKGKQASRELGVGLLGVGAAVTALAATAVARFVEFDKALSGVRANVQATPAEFGKLKAAAIDAGASTIYTAGEAANAITNLGKAGVTAEQIMGGGLKGALSLAAAGEIEVADAADIAATAMTQFRLSGEEIPHLADLLAAGANKAQGSVGDLGFALKQSGLVASQMGFSVEETVGTLTAFASAGLLGSDAGTSFRTMLLSLANPSAKARDVMKEFGIAAYDANGVMVSSAELAGQLQEAFVGRTNAERDAALATIFGSDAIRAANVLYNEGEAGILKWTDAVDEAGFAAGQAATLQDNMAGDVEKLGGALDSMFIVAGEGANGPLRELVQGVTGLVEAFSALPPEVSQGILLLGGIIGVAALAGGAFFLAVPKVLEFRSAIAQLNTDVPSLRGNLGKVGAFLTGPWGIALAAGGTILSMFADHQATTAGQVETLTGTLDTQTGAITENTRATVAKRLQDEGVLSSAKKAGIGLDLVTDAAMGNAAAIREVQRRASDWYNEQKGKGIPALVEGSIAYGHLTDNVRILGGQLAESEAGWEAVAEATSSGAAASDEATASIASQAAATEEAEEALAKWREEIMEADGSFIDLAGNIDDIRNKTGEWAEGATASTTAAGESWDEFYEGAALNLETYLADLERQITAQSNWETNMILLAGKVSQGTIDYLSKMGLEGAPLVQALVDGSIEDLARFETGVSEKVGAGAAAFTTTLEDAAPVISAAAAQLGDGAAREIAAKLQAGTHSIEQIMAEYKLRIEGQPPTARVIADTERAEETLLRFTTAPRSTTVAVKWESRGGGGSFAAGSFRGAMDEADGGIVRYANGGISENHTAQIAKAGQWRVWAEDETGGEAYIPLHPGKRGASTEILATVARLFGMSLIPTGAQRFAGGGMTAAPAPSRREALPISGRLRLDLGNSEAWVEGIVDDRLDAENETRENGFRL